MGNPGSFSGNTAKAKRFGDQGNNQKNNAYLNMMRFSILPKRQGKKRKDAEAAIAFRIRTEVFFVSVTYSPDGSAL
jgi:hypothetical protein